MTHYRIGLQAHNAIAFLTVLLLAVTCGSPPAGRVEGLKAFVGARLIDGTGADPINDAVLVIRDGRIESVGPATQVSVPEGALLVDLRGRTIMPGMINTHGHVGGTRGLKTDDFSEENLLRQLGLYARYGVTTVNSLGGDGLLSVGLRNEQETSALDRSRLFIAGPVVVADTPEQARIIVSENAAMGVDFIKLRVDDGLGSAKKMSPQVYKAVIEKAHEYDLPVAAHMVYLEDAEALVAADVDFLAHSIRDELAGDDFIDLMSARQIPYCPTLMREVSVFAYESIPEFFHDPYFKLEADLELLEQLTLPDRSAQIKNSESAQWYKAHLEIAMRNLKALSDGGALIAFGTDTGPPGRFQGYFEHLELSMMAEAGMSPMEIILSATRNAAKAIGRDDIGTLESTKWGDFIVLAENPLMDIENSRTIESVWIAGNKVASKR
ncbi:MAG: amidohydrolase family protein [Candidatus Latescibacteria bacterium]|nr:amidohydrolase family protein [Candidatus Latescibacterota bacterium]